MTDLERRLRRELGFVPTASPDKKLLADIKNRAVNPRVSTHYEPRSFGGRVAFTLSLAASIAALVAVGVMTTESPRLQDPTSGGDATVAGDSRLLSGLLLASVVVFMGLVFVSSYRQNHRVRRNIGMQSTVTDRKVWLGVTGATILLSAAPVVYSVGGFLAPTSSQVVLNNLTFDPTSEVVAATSTGSDTLFLWRIDSPHTPQRIDTTHIEISDIAFSSDGKNIATTGLDGFTRFWAVEDGRQNADPLATTSGVSRIAYPTENRLVAPSQESVKFIDPETQVEVDDPILWDDLDFALDITADGRFVITSYQRISGEFVENIDEGVRLWDLELRKEVADLERVESWVSQTHLSPDGSIAVIEFGDSNSVIIWDTETDELPSPINESPIVVLAVHDNQLVAIDQDAVSLRQDIKATSSNTTVLTESRATDAAFNFEGDVLAVAQQDGTIQLWDTAELEPLGVPLQLPSRGDN